MSWSHHIHAPALRQALGKHLAQGLYTHPVLNLQRQTWVLLVVSYPPSSKTRPHASLTIVLQEGHPKIREVEAEFGFSHNFWLHMGPKPEVTTHTFCLRAWVSLGIRASAFPMTGMMLTFSCTARRKATSRGRSLHPGICQGPPQRGRYSQPPPCPNPQGDPSRPPAKG